MWFAENMGGVWTFVSLSELAIFFCLDYYFYYYREPLRAGLSLSLSLSLCVCVYVFL